MKTILTVQHTQSIHHTNGMVGSWTNWDLTPKGIAQAEKIAKHLKAEYPDTSFRIYTSDLLRASQTATPIGIAFGVTPERRTELRERNLGRCCGKSVQWLRENLEQPEITVDDRLFSDGESRRDAWNRLAPFYRELMESGDENIILVSHGDLLSIFQAMFLGHSVESLERFELSGMAGGVSTLFINDKGKHFLRRLNDPSYLR